jgi:hypothetical protein
VEVSASIDSASIDPLWACGEGAALILRNSRVRPGARHPACRLQATPARTARLPVQALTSIKTGRAVEPMMNLVSP